MDIRELFDETLSALVEGRRPHPGFDGELSLTELVYQAYTAGLSDALVDELQEGSVTEDNVAELGELFIQELVEGPDEDEDDNEGFELDELIETLEIEVFEADELDQA